MPAVKAQYSCDECRSRKIKCSRNTPSCDHCVSNSWQCVYSRSGIIRRRARGPRRHASSPVVSRDQPAQDEPNGTINPEDEEWQPQIVSEIIGAQTGFAQSTENDPTPFHALATLDAEYASFWPGQSLPEEMRPRGPSFFAFDEEQAAALTGIYVSVLRKGEPFFTSTPPEIVCDLATRPGNVRESARLVIFYGILLTARHEEPWNDLTMNKLRWNLRTAINDARLLLEPSDVNIQALVMLACHVQEFTTPSLCWMLITNACRMLQALGVRNRCADAETRARRIDLFWSLNGLDKSLAIIFRRPPTFHRSMCRAIPQLPFSRLLQYRPHIDYKPIPNDNQSESTQNIDVCQSLFGAHYMRQMHLLSNIMSEVWHCLHEDVRLVEKTKSELDAWYKACNEVLQATLLAEKPMLEEHAVRSMQIGLDNVRFQYHHLVVLLTRGHAAWKSQCIASSCEAMAALEGLVSDSSDVFNGIVWQLLFCPFTPFFVLLGDVLSTGDLMSKSLSYEAMQRLPRFLKQMISIHSQASNLHDIASTVVQYAARYSQTQSRHNSHVTSAVTSIINPSSSGDVSPQNFAAQTEINTPQQEPAANASHRISWEDLLNDASVQALPFELPAECSTSQMWQFTDFGEEPYAMQGPTTSEESSSTYNTFAQTTFDWLDWEYDSNMPT